MAPGDCQGVGGMWGSRVINQGPAPPPPTRTNRQTHSAFMDPPSPLCVVHYALPPCLVQQMIVHCAI